MTRSYIEDIATSKKRTELATQQCADKAFGNDKGFKSFNRKLDKMDSSEKISFCQNKIKILKSKISYFQTILNQINSDNNSDNEIDNIDSDDYDFIYPIFKKDSERFRKREERLAKKEAKIKSMSPTSQSKYLEKQEFLAKRRQERSKMTKEERLEYKKQKIKDKLSQMTPERLAKYNEKQKIKKANKDKFDEMSLEEKLEFKKQKQLEKLDKKLKYQYLTNNWSDEIPNDLGHLIIDGNNMRGGGPRRHSRDTIIKHIHQTMELNPQLQNTNITVWFDHKPAKYTPIDKINVKFSHDEIADDLIVKETEELIKDKSVLIVTADRLLAIRLLELGGLVMRNGKFNTYNPDAPKRKH